MVEKDTVRRGYDRIADTYAAHRADNAIGNQYVDQLLDRLPSDPIIVDAGCGGGEPVLAKIVPRSHAVGVDFSRGQLIRAQSTVPDAAIALGDLTDLPIQAETVDGVIAFWSMIHIPIDDHQAAIDEFSRILRPGGWLLIQEGTNAWQGRNPDWLDTGEEMQWHIAGAEVTTEQLAHSGFVLHGTWEVAETLEGDDADAEDEDLPWTIWLAQRA